MTFPRCCSIRIRNSFSRLCIQRAKTSLQLKTVRFFSPIDTRNRGLFRFALREIDFLLRRSFSHSHFLFDFRLSSFFSLSHRVASLQSMFFGYLRENLSASDSLDAAFIHSRVYNRLSRLPGWDETQRAYYMELLSVPPFPRFSHPAEERIDLRRNIISPQDPQRAIESAETRDFEPAARDRLRSRILESITCSSARCFLRTARPSSKRSASISTCKTAMILIGSRVCST